MTFKDKEHHHEIRVNLDMTGAMATLPKTGSESVVDYKPVISDAGADANIAGIPGTYYGIVPKGTGKITVTNGVQRKPWVGLTDEEQQAAYDAWQQKDDGWGSFYDLIEAKLREKNK